MRLDSQFFGMWRRQCIDPGFAGWDILDRIGVCMSALPNIDMTITRCQTFLSLHTYSCRVTVGLIYRRQGIAEEKKQNTAVQ